MSPRSSRTPRPLYAKSPQSSSSNAFDRGRLETRPTDPKRIRDRGGIWREPGTARKAIGALAIGATGDAPTRPRHIRGWSTPRALFRFFNMLDATGITDHPRQLASHLHRRSRGPARANGIRHLCARCRGHPYRPRHVRAMVPLHLRNHKAPQELFPDLAQLDPLPNTLYDLFQKTYGILLAAHRGPVCRRPRGRRRDRARLAPSRRARPCFGSIARPSGSTIDRSRWRVQPVPLAGRALFGAYLAPADSPTTSERKRRSGSSQ